MRVRVMRVEVRVEAAVAGQTDVHVIRTEVHVEEEAGQFYAAAEMTVSLRLT